MYMDSCQSLLSSCPTSTLCLSKWPALFFLYLFGLSMKAFPSPPHWSQCGIFILNLISILSFSLRKPKIMVLFIIYCCVTAYPKSKCLKLPTFIISVSLGKESESCLAGWFWFKVSWSFSQESGWGCSLIRRLNKGRIHLPTHSRGIGKPQFLIGCWSEASVPHHMDLVMS